MDIRDKFAITVRHSKPSMVDPHPTEILVHVNKKISDG